MVKKEIVIGLKQGLQATAAALLVQTASRYKSDVRVLYGDKKVNAKSIMGMMSLVLAQGEKVTVVTEGEDENEAAKGIEEYLGAEA